MAVVFAFAANWIYPLPFLPPAIPHLVLGLLVLLLALLLIRWAIKTFREAKTNLLTNKAALTIVSTGPFAYSRNPIYVAILLSFVGFAIAADSLWFFLALAIMFFVLRFGIIAQEEIYLTKKFGQTYLNYKTKVRCWL
jgi:protein-S-isoprenylcysteine O-methyltransferase Ste14